MIDFYLSRTFIFSFVCYFYLFVQARKKETEKGGTGWGGNEKMGTTSTCMDEHCPLGWGWERGENREGRKGTELLNWTLRCDPEEQEQKRECKWKWG